MKREAFIRKWLCTENPYTEPFRDEMREDLDKVIAHLNTENKKGLDDRLRDKLIEQPDNQEGLSNKKDMELPTDEQIEAYALKNILDGVGIQSMKNTKAWIEGATWMRDLIQGRRIK